MSQRALRIFVAHLAVTALISLVSLPAQAYSSVEEASAAIDVVAEQAASEIGEVLDEFAATIETLGTEAAIIAAADDARDEVDALWVQARDQIGAIKSEYPTELGSVAGGREVRCSAGSLCRPQYDRRSRSKRHPGIELTHHNCGNDHANHINLHNRPTHLNHNSRGRGYTASWGTSSRN